MTQQYQRTFRIFNLNGLHGFTYRSGEVDVNTPGVGMTKAFLVLVSIVSLHVKDDSNLPWID